jgi:PAS domain S-box-containing protein
MSELDIILKYILPTTSFVINIFCIAYSLGLNPSSKRNKAYIYYLISVNFWILTDPVIFYFNIDYYYTQLITQIRPIFYLSIGILFINLVYKLTYKSVDIFYKIYLASYLACVFVTIFTKLIIKDFVYLNWYVESIPGSFYLIAILFSIIIPLVHSFYILIVNIINGNSKIIKIQLSLLLFGSILMFLIGIFSDVIFPFILNIDSTVRLGSSIMAFQVIFIMPSILKYDLLTMSLDEFVLDLFEETGEGIIVVDLNGEILNGNFTAEKLIGKNIDEIKNQNIELFFKHVNINKNYNSFITTLESNQNKYYSITSSKLKKMGYQLGKMYLFSEVTGKVNTEKELKLSQEILDRAQKISKSGNWEENHLKGTLNWSKNCKLILGYKVNQIITNEMFWERVHPEDKNWMISLWNEIEKIGDPHKGIFRIILPNGKIRYIEEQAEFIYKTNVLIKTIGTIKDITNTHLSKIELENSENRLKEAQSVAHIGSFDYDLKNNSILWSDELYRIYGLKKESFNVSNDGFFSLVHPDDKVYIKNCIKEAISNHNLLEYDHRLIRNDNFDIRIMHCRAKISYDKNENAIRIAGTSQDVTEIRNAEIEIKKSREQLRKLASHLQIAQEKERARISREIHDELGQELTGIKMDISWLSNSLKNPDDKIKERIGSLNKLIDTTIQSVRRISAELRPGVLDDLGLISALEWYVEEYQQRTKIKCKLLLGEISNNLESDISIAIYRIIQESLTNVARHANASKIILSLKLDELNIYLKIQDNGFGFNKDSSKSEKSIGILGMEERVHILGGTFSILGSKRDGTVIKVEIPFKKNNSEVE